MCGCCSGERTCLLSLAAGLVCLFFFLQQLRSTNSPCEMVIFSLLFSSVIFRLDYAPEFAPMVQLAHSTPSALSVVVMQRL